MESFKAKSIAVASGKGGVGKTTTCVNLAIYFARSGLKTGLIDLDPLSDIATLFDITEAGENISSEKGDKDSLKSNRINILPKLDLIFPEASLKSEDNGTLKKLESLRDEISTEYDKIILDLPAGSLYEENIVFLKYTNKLIIVTNDEPTAHTASGYYIKQAHNSGNELEYLIWHNKYAGITTAGFDPMDLPGNYNKNVAEEDRFDFSKVKMTEAAFIPHDPAMDLLQSNPSLTVNILAQISERLDFVIEQRIDELAFSASLPGQSGSLIRHYLHLNPYIMDVQNHFNKLSEYIYVIMNTKTLKGAADYNKAIMEGGMDVFTARQKADITGLIESIKNDKMMGELIKTSAQVKIAIDNQKNSTRLFFSDPNEVNMKAIDKRLSHLIRALHSERNNHNSYIKTTAGLLLFDFSIYKLLGSKTVTDLIGDFIPVRKNKRGENIRDKHKQILQLVKKDEKYKKEYLRLIDILFPVVLKQIAAVVETFNIAGLLFNNNEGIQKEVYLKLLSNFLHNSINSGLGVVVGFPFRPASAAFEKSAAALI